MIPEPFNRGWYVRKEGAGAPEPVGPVTLPYDAMLFERRDPETPNSHHTGFFPGGAYRYSKSFWVPEEWRGNSVALEFEGVYMRSEVLVNGRLAGGRPSGYAIFQVALDDLIDYCADNVVEVVVRNDRVPNSRWYSGSGIYRPVHLLVGGRVRVTPVGPRFVTRSIQDGGAVVEIVTAIVNDGTEHRTVTLTTRLTGPGGATVGSVEEEFWAERGEATVVRQQVTVPGADLWSPETPRLHCGSVVVADGAEVLDQASAEFGIRALEVDANRGLRINGAGVKLRGACIHHDSGVIGAHTLDAAEDRRIRILKDAGYNAIRSAHNPCSRATLRACDRHGVLVMDELTDAWWRPKVTFDVAQEFEQWWQTRPRIDDRQGLQPPVGRAVLHR